jgi:hypothetical protein
VGALLAVLLLVLSLSAASVMLYLRRRRALPRPVILDEKEAPEAESASDAGEGENLVK